ncbi:MAG: hypothetical protein EA397_15325 [Deltaproteobacteria bacterium]|nr:MAG: hypothetical protein EA397_15325 [Deltaproteobacteria bacterium]
MSKTVTIASLNRAAARSEAEFTTTVQEVIDEADHERTAEFFDKMNIPRSVPGELTNEPLPVFNVGTEGIGDYEQERAIGDGIQKFLDRHERKIKWHAGHPSLEGCDNVVFIMRTASAVTLHRFERLQLLLRSKDEVSAVEWSISRELMNRAYLSYRNFLDLMIGPWLEAIVTTLGREAVTERLGSFYELIDETLRSMEQHRKRIEERRLELTVIPLHDTYPPVKPPNYFGGDLMGVGPWSQFWHQVQVRAQHFREHSA